MRNAPAWYILLITRIRTTTPFIVANQWTFIENSTKRPDVLLFLNGMPVVLVELKSPLVRKRMHPKHTHRFATICMIPSMFIYNCICVMSDLMTSKAGTITSGEDRFMEWKTKDGGYENTQYAQFDTFFEGILKKNVYWILSRTLSVSPMKEPNSSRY